MYCDNCAKLEAQLAEAQRKAEAWMNRCQEVMVQLDSQSYLNMKLEQDRLCEANTRLHEDVETFEGAVDRLRTALEAVEWVETGQPGYKYHCPQCRRFKEFGHDNNCALQAALNPQERAKK